MNKIYKKLLTLEKYLEKCGMTKEANRVKNLFKKASMDMENEGERASNLVRYDSQHNNAILDLDEEIFGDRDPSIFHDSEGFVLLKGELLLGYILYQVENTNVHLRSLGVLPSQQSRGLGQQLLKLVVELADRQGHSMSLAIDPNFRQSIGAPEKLRNLYRKFDFSDSGRRNPNGNELWVRPRPEKKNIKS